MGSSLSTAAERYYQKLSSENRLSLQHRFRSLDTDGDGVISHTELLNYSETEVNRYTRTRGFETLVARFTGRLDKLFPILDEDRNGFLNFKECISLFFLVKSCTDLCDHCGRIIVDFGFTCGDCFGLRVYPSFDLCLDCCLPKISTHKHANFVPKRVELAELVAEHTNHVQCLICGDFHRPDIDGFFSTSGSHMRITSPVSCYYVCEWCFTWFCSKYGKFDNQGLSSAAPGDWLVKTHYHSSCGEAGDLTCLDSTIHVRSRSEK